MSADQRQAGAPRGRIVIPALAQRFWILFVLLALVAIVSWIGHSGSNSLQRTTVTMLVNLVVVVGLYSFIGTSGVFSFGHMAFMLTGAYTTAILLIPTETKSLVFTSMFGVLQSAHLPPLLALCCGGVVAALLAVLLSAPLLRLSGLNAALGTFAVLIIVNVVATNLDQVTNGAQGMSGIPPIAFTTALLIALAVIVIAWLFQAFPVFMRLVATREDEFAARAVGIRITWVRAVGFIFSAFLVGIAGGLFGQAQGAIQPNAFYLEATFLTIAMLVVGGMNSLTGAVVGTVVLSVFSQLLTQIEQGLNLGFVTVHGPTGLRQVGYSVILLAILILRPNGLTGGRELTWPFRRRSEAESGGGSDSEARVETTGVSSDAEPQTLA